MPLEFKLPDVGEGIDGGELVEWHIAEGQAVVEDEPMAEVQTDKATVTIPCPTTGKVVELRAKAGDVIPVGAVMAVFEPSESEQPAQRLDAPRASPAVRRRALELGVELAHVRGTGPGGRIESRDLDEAMARSAGGAAGSGPSSRTGQVVPLRGIRRTIAHTMTEAWRTIPHIIDYREVDATELLGWRDRLRELTAVQGDESLRRALTITPLVLHMAVQVLREHPYVNASIDMERGEILLHDKFNVGVATATPDGLVVPVVKDADAKQVSDLALEVAELTDAARQRRLRPDQLAQGTFTVNNYGSLGVWLGTPIIKPGEVANLGIGRVQERPVAVDGQVVVRPIVALAVSGDHRVLDGHTLGAFVSDLVGLIEDPATQR
jgi:pyruvate dehydrogenase E2 component (dihydrolipoamide acetyltransferase)